MKAAFEGFKSLPLALKMGVSTVMALVVGTLICAVITVVTFVAMPEAKNLHVMLVYGLGVILALGAFISIIVEHRLYLWRRAHPIGLK